MADTIVGPARKLGRVEFIWLLALSMSLAALGIDLMLPAFGEMRADLGLEPGATEIAGTVTAYFLGMALGQFIYGPIADRFGRRRALYIGYCFYALGAGLSAASPTLGLLLASRFAWGFGSAGPAVVTRAVIRDTFEGDQMSRIMSLVVAVLILVPVIAPSIGSLAIMVMSWRWLFVACVGAAIMMALWARRLPETLREEHRLPLRPARIARATAFVLTTRRSLLYMLAMTSLYGVFMHYVASAENLFIGIYDQEDAFPFIFGALAATIGLFMLVNARIVHRVGTLKLAHRSLLVYLALSAVVAIISFATGGIPPLGVLIGSMVAMLACHALLIPNLTTISLAPLGHIAGTGSSIIGAIQLGGGAGFGMILDQAFDGTTRPLSLGFFGLGLFAMILVLIAERGRLFGVLSEEEIDPTVHTSAGTVPSIEPGEAAQSDVDPTDHRAGPVQDPLTRE